MPRCYSAAANRISRLFSQGYFKEPRLLQHSFLPHAPQLPSTSTPFHQPQSFNLISSISSTNNHTTQHNNRVSPNGTSRESGLPPYLLGHRGATLVRVVWFLRDQGRLNAAFYPLSTLFGRSGVLGGSRRRRHAKAVGERWGAGQRELSTNIVACVVAWLGRGMQHGRCFLVFSFLFGPKQPAFSFNQNCKLDAKHRTLLSPCKFYY